MEALLGARLADSRNSPPFPLTYPPYEYCRARSLVLNGHYLYHAAVYSWRCMQLLLLKGQTEAFHFHKCSVLDFLTYTRAMGRHRRGSVAAGSPLHVSAAICIVSSPLVGHALCVRCPRRVWASSSRQRPVYQQVRSTHMETFDMRRLGRQHVTLLLWH